MFLLVSFQGMGGYLWSHDLSGGGYLWYKIPSGVGMSTGLVCPGGGYSPPRAWDLGYYGVQLTVHILLECFLITVCKSSCGKVMCSQACVKNSVQGGDGCAWQE